MPPQAPPPPSHKVLIGLVIFGGVILIFVIGAIVIGQTFKPTAGAGSAAPNPSNTSTPTPTPTPTPANPALAPKTADYVNLDTLLDYGITSDQLSALKYAFTKYGRVSGTPTSGVTLDPASLVVTPHDRDSASPNNLATFTVMLNSTVTYHASLTYSGLSAIDLVLANPAGAKVWDSGTIDLYNGIGDN